MPTEEYRCRVCLRKDNHASLQYVVLFVAYIIMLADGFITLAWGSSFNRHRSYLWHPTSASISPKPRIGYEKLMPIPFLIVWTAIVAWP